MIRPPWLVPLLTALAIAAVIALALGWSAFMHRRGEQAGRTAVQAEWERERNANARLVLHAIERRDDAQRALDTALAQRDSQHAKEIDHVQQEREALREQLRTGAVRVSVPTRVPECPAAGSGHQPGRAAAEPVPAHAELDPAFAQDLAGITADGDAAIVDLNACIDRYSAVRAAAGALIETHRAQAP